jgi:hypothetical protein
MEIIFLYGPLLIFYVGLFILSIKSYVSEQKYLTSSLKEHSQNQYAIPGITAAMRRSKKDTFDFLLFMTVCTILVFCYLWKIEPFIGMRFESQMTDLIYEIRQAHDRY